MKKSFLVLSLSVLVYFGGFKTLGAQDQPKPKKDTVNIDTDAKPTFYYPVEDEKKANSGKGSSLTFIVIAGVVVVAGIAGYFFLKKKSK